MANEPDIIVNGYRINYGGGTNGGGGFFEYPHMSGNDHPTIGQDGGGGGPEEPNDFNPPTIAAEILDPANADKIQQAAEKVANQVLRLTPLIAAIPDNKKITLKDGTELTGAQLKALWNKADFLITDRNDFGTDRGGRSSATSHG